MKHFDISWFLRWNPALRWASGSHSPYPICSCCCCCCYVASVVSDSVWPHRRQPTRLPSPWDSPGKNTGLGCRFLLQFMKVKSESEVAQSYPTLSDPMDCSLPGPSVRGIFQARGLGWGASASSAFAPRIWLISRRSPRQFGVVSVAPGSIICGPGIWPGTSIMCLGQIPHLY